MDFKKIMLIFIVMIMVGALIGIHAVSAATSRVAICDSNSDEVSSFHSSSNDESLQIYARLYVDGEWKAWRNLDFDIYDPSGNQLFHVTSLTSFVTGYAGVGIWINHLYELETGDYTVIVSYGGNEDKGWPATSTTAVIHRTKN